jgi:hypothetical protein
MYVYALLGAMVAGFFGIIHGQITYSISLKYFTRLKFLQFHYDDFGLPLRVFVAKIGFLATRWVGLLRGPHASYATWQQFVNARGIVDVPSFVRVAYIHNASHLAGLTGLVIALIRLRRLKPAAT